MQINRRSRSNLAAKLRPFLLLGLSLLSCILVMLTELPGLTLPPEDQPEEVLRTEIILDARSPEDGSLITPAEYAEQQARIEAQNQAVGTVPPEIRRLIGLLRLRKALRSILPFLIP